MTGVAVDPECVRAVEKTAQLCEDLGHHVFPFTPEGIDGDELTSAFLVLYTAGVGAAVAAWSATLGREPGPDDLEPLTRAMREGQSATLPAPALPTTAPAGHNGGTGGAA